MRLRKHVVYNPFVGFVWVAIGGAAGSCLRYWVSLMLGAFTVGPAVNVTSVNTPSIERSPSISPDGRYLLFGMTLAIDNHDVYAVEIDDPSSAQPFLETESIECGARFSPDGRWVAYVSNATGRFEVYVTDWPANRLQRQVSSECAEVALMFSILAG